VRVEEAEHDCELRGRSLHIRTRLPVRASTCLSHSVPANLRTSDPPVRYSTYTTSTASAESKRLGSILHGLTAICLDGTASTGSSPAPPMG